MIMRCGHSRNNSYYTIIISQERWDVKTNEKKKKGCNFLFVETLVKYFFAVVAQWQPDEYRGRVYICVMYIYVCVIIYGV